MPVTDTIDAGFDTSQCLIGGRWIGAGGGRTAAFSGELTLPAGPLGLTVRVMPRHPNLGHAADMRLVVNA